METPLIDKFGEVECPAFYSRQICSVETIEFGVGDKELESDFL